MAAVLFGFALLDRSNHQTSNGALTMRRHFFLAAGMVCWVATPAAALEVRCVDNATEFNSALALAEDSDDVEIRIVRGTYDLSGTLVDTIPDLSEGLSHAVTVRGGYAPGCGSRTLGARETVITVPNGSFRLLATGDVVIEDLTFREVLNGITVSAEGQFSADYRVIIRRVWADRSGQLTALDVAEVDFEQVLVTRSSGRYWARNPDQLVVECAVAALSKAWPTFSGDYLEVARFRHLTVSASAPGVPGLCTGFDIDLEYRVLLTNSVFWNNPGGDILLRRDGTLGATLLHNTYATLGGAALEQPPVGTLNVNPQFVDPSNDNWELGGTSSSINSAFPISNQTNATDLDGQPRVFAGIADRGALESAIGSTATTLVVTTTADPAQPTPGTLRQAILDANASPNVNRIEFDIGTTCGPRVINLFSPLPPITSGVIIDGYSQPGAVRNTSAVGDSGQVCIILQGGSSALGGLTVPTSVPESMQVQIEGLGFSNFAIVAVQLAGGNAHTVLGSRFGGQIGQIDLMPNGYGVQVSNDATDVRIGTTLPGDRNVFGESTIAAIALGGSIGNLQTDATIQNNYIGLAANGSTPSPNAAGILVNGAYNLITGNTISSNSGDGIDVRTASAFSNRIVSNRIGLTAGVCLVACDRGNGGHGVRVRDGANDIRVEANVIHNNDGDGVAIVAARENRILGNEFAGNSGEGIDLGNDGFTVNNNDYLAPPGGGSNFGQNYPVLSLAGGGSSSGTVSGTLATRNGWYRVEFYATDESCSAILPGQGRWFLGSTIVTVTGGSAATGNGTGAFSQIPIALSGVSNFFQTPRNIVATATRYPADPAFNPPPLETSEFSPCIAYTSVMQDAIFANGYE